MYKAQVKILNKIYDAEGDSVQSAISNLKPEGKIAGNVILRLSKGDVVKEKIINSNLLSRLFSPSRVTREIALKNTTMLFNL